MSKTIAWKNWLQKQIKTNKLIVIGFILLLFFVASLFFLLPAKPDQTVLTANRQVWKLAEDIRQHYRKRPDAWGLSNQYVIEKEIVDDTFISDGSLRNSLGKEILIGANSDGSIVMPGSRNFAITYKNLDFEECVQLASMPLNEQEQLALTSIVITNNHAQTQFIWGGENPLPISRKSAKQACEKENSVTWFLYI